MKIRTKILAIMAVPIAFLGVSTVAMFDAGAQTAASLKEERRASALLTSFREIEIDLIDAESATRAYLISGEVAQLNRYEQAATRLPGDFATMTSLAEDGGVLSIDDMQTLRELANERLSILQTAQLMAPVDDETNRDQLSALTSSGGVVMQRFVSLIDREEGDATRQVEERQASLDAARRRWFLIGVAGLPIGMLVSILVVGLYSRRIGRRLARTEEVARLLHEGMPLGEPSTSKDELGKLERVLIESGTRVVELQGELRRIGTTDPPTRLLNRRGFIPSAEHQLEVAKRTHQPMALLFVDLDGLKRVNDTHGHAAGDAMITEAAYVMTQTFRAADLIGRIGGDEFCVLFATESRVTAEVALARLQSLVLKMNEQDDRLYRLSLSVGLAMFDPEAPLTFDELMVVGDERMYEAKRAKATT